MHAVSLAADPGGPYSKYELLRIEGFFHGKLVSKGDLIIGPEGTLKGDIKEMGEVIVDGKVIGDMEVKQVSELQ